MENLIVATKVRNRRAQKHKDIEQMIEENYNKVPPISEEEFYAYLNNEQSNNKGRTRLDRIERNLRNGKTIKPCGRECPSWGNLIIKTNDHTSIKYSKFLINDMEYLLNAGRLTNSPLNCKNFFYNYINKYLKRNANFRLEFLKSLYLNDHIFTKDDIMAFVDDFGFQEENDIITCDEEFFVLVKEKFACYFYEMPERDWQNIDEKKEQKVYIKNTKKINDEIEERVISLLSLFKKFFKVIDKETADKIDDESNEKFDCESNKNFDDDLKDFYIPDDGSWSGFSS